MPVTQRNILPGTRIWSDEWPVYQQLAHFGYVHETVNHSQHLVNPATGVHTNNIEVRWLECKVTFKRRYWVTCRRRHPPSYLTCDGHGDHIVASQSSTPSLVQFGHSVAMTHPLPLLFSGPPTFCKRRQHDTECMLAVYTGVNMHVFVRKKCSGHRAHHMWWARWPLHFFLTNTCMLTPV